MRSFNIAITAEWDLSEDEIWPDGDGPENPTTADVIAELTKIRPQRRALHDWNLDEYEVTVDGEEVTW